MVVEIENSEWTPINQLELGKRYRQLFLIDDVQKTSRMISKNQVPFAKMRLRDISGNITGTVFGGIDLRPGQYVKMTLDVEL